MLNAIRRLKLYYYAVVEHLRQGLACLGSTRRRHSARVAPDSREGTRASREVRITRAKGVRYVILLELDASELSIAEPCRIARVLAHPKSQP